MTGPAGRRDIGRVLVAIDDSAAGLAAAEVALGLAEALHAEVRFVAVLGDAELVRALRTMRIDQSPSLDERRRAAAASMVRREVAQARRVGVHADGEVLPGEPAPVLLAEAKSWGADLLVVGEPRRGGHRPASVVGLVSHLMEFAECPVLVVPSADS